MTVEPTAETPGYRSPTGTMLPGPGSPFPSTDRYAEAYGGPRAGIAALPGGAATGGTTPEELQQALIEAQMAALAPIPAADYSEQRASAQNLRSNIWNDLAHFGGAMAQGESPYFAANAGAGISKLAENHDKKWERYNVAMNNLAATEETARSNRTREHIAAIEAAKPGTRGSVNDPVLDSILAVRQDLWDRKSEAIEDPNNQKYFVEGGEELRAQDRAALQDEIDNFYAAIGRPLAAPDFSLADE